jgi:hypothetical protein
VNWSMFHQSQRKSSSPIKMYVPDGQLRLSSAGHHQLSPPAITTSYHGMLQHLRNGHKATTGQKLIAVDLSAMGLKPLKTKLAQIDVESIMLKKQHGHQSLVAREMRNLNRQKAVKYLKETKIKESTDSSGVHKIKSKSSHQSLVAREMKSKSREKAARLLKAIRFQESAFNFWQRPSFNECTRKKAFEIRCKK